MSSTVLVVGLVMEHLYPSCNQVLRIIEVLASYGKRLESRLRFILLCHGSPTILVVGHLSQPGYQNCKIWQTTTEFYLRVIFIHLLGLQLKLLHNAYHILPTLHTIFKAISSIIKGAKAVSHCFDMTNTIWQNQLPTIFLMWLLEQHTRSPQGRQC